MLVCDGLKHLPDSVTTVWPDTVVQTCVDLMRNSFTCASRRDWDAISKALKPVYQAATVEEAEDRFGGFQEAWGATYPAIVRLRENAWAQYHPVPPVRPPDPTDRLHDHRGRVRERQNPQGRESPGAFPQRAGRPEMRPSGRHGAGPHRQGPSPMDPALEGRVERPRHHLQRAPVHPRQLNTETTQLHR